MVDLDDEWSQIPIAELHQFDALCDQFEQRIDRDPSTRIEQFLARVTSQQRQCLVRELVRLEVEKRTSRGERLTAEEYGSRFPQWMDEIQTLATKTIEDIDQAANATTSASVSSTETAESILSGGTVPQWSPPPELTRHFQLPVDGMLGHYQLQSVIGQGGMGLVLRARDTKLTREVAVKILSSTLSQSDTVHERFLREARAAAVVRHAHVVTIYAVEEIDERPFLVMEFIEGITLEKYQQAVGQIPIGEVVSLACQIAEGLEAAHRQSLIHRDIKPTNILLEKVDSKGNRVRPLSNWHVKITDFGLARVTSEQQLTSSGFIAGTPQYMSPEQADGMELDKRSDLFSLGSVMYAMCAGRPAFEAESAIAIARQVADKPAPSLAEIRPETPVWLVEVIEKLMVKSPDDRFQSAGELIALLVCHLHDGDAGSPHAQAKTTAAESARQNQTLEGFPRLLQPFTRVKSALSAIALLAIVMIGFWFAQIVFRVETPHGTLIVQSDDPDVQISVKSGGAEVALFFPAEKKEIPLKIGKYAIELAGGKSGLKLSTNRFEITSGQDQRTVTVDFEPAVVASMDPPTVTEQSKAVDVEKPFAWPAEALWHGLVAAPDLSQTKELYRDNFASTWPTAKMDGGEIGREQDTYFISADPGLVRAKWIDDKTYTNFVCQVVGSVQSKGTQWYLGYTSVIDGVTVRFHLNGIQSLQVSILNDGPPRVAQTIRHTALKKDKEFNKILVMAIGNRFEIFANDVAICNPIVLHEITMPGRFDLGVVANHMPVRAEFKSFTIWSAEGLPTPEQRLDGGRPYNQTPFPE